MLRRGVAIARRQPASRPLLGASATTLRTCASGGPGKGPCEYDAPTRVQLIAEWDQQLPFVTGVALVATMAGIPWYFPAAAAAGHGAVHVFTVRKDRLRDVAEYLVRAPGVLVHDHLANAPNQVDKLLFIPLFVPVVTVTATFWRLGYVPPHVTAKRNISLWWGLVWVAYAAVFGLYYAMVELPKWTVARDLICVDVEGDFGDRIFLRPFDAARRWIPTGAHKVLAQSGLASMVALEVDRVAAMFAKHRVTWVIEEELDGAANATATVADEIRLPKGSATTARLVNAAAVDAAPAHVAAVSLDASNPEALARSLISCMMPPMVNALIQQRVAGGRSPDDATPPTLQEMTDFAPMVFESACSVRPLYHRPLLVLRDFGCEANGEEMQRLLDFVTRIEWCRLVVVVRPPSERGADGGGPIEPRGGKFAASHGHRDGMTERAKECLDARLAAGNANEATLRVRFVSRLAAAKA